MSYKLAVGGDINSGKSFSRRTIRDGENVIIIQSSQKMSHLFTSEKKPVKTFDLKGNKYPTLLDAQKGLNAPTAAHVILYFTQMYNEGKLTLKPEQLTGNIITVKEIDDLPVWLNFISICLPWIHTVIIADFTHFISEILSRREFINKRAGGDAFTKFWELAGDALRNFILSLDSYRENLIIVTEYHTAYDEKLDEWRIYVPAGNMLTGKFKPESYYDIFLMTDVKIDESDKGDIIKESYTFVTKRTKAYPLARGANLFDQRIPNDLQLVLDKVRTYLGMELPK